MLLLSRSKPWKKTLSRDTQFQGFASSLGAEIADTDGWNLADVEKLIARRAYDLVLHATWNIAPRDLERLWMKEVAAKVPDLPDLPDMERGENE